MGLISSRFVTFWEPQYDTQKFPKDFYLSHIACAQNAESPEQLKEHLLALLHWKDGKAIAYVPGEKHAKPNTLKPICTLTNTHLADFVQIFRDLVQADENDVLACTKRLCVKLRGMWNTVVIPAFILHVARPDRFPIIDQHTVRAWLSLTKGKVIKDLNSSITWDHWREYKIFFRYAVEDAGYGHNTEERCKVDRALFAWGKSLKGSCGSKPDARTAKPSKSPSPELGPISNGPLFWGQRVPNTGVIPTACNVLIALQRYLDLEDVDLLPQHHRQALRDLQFQNYEQSDLSELMENPGRNVAGKLLQYYKQEMGGGSEIRRLPRPILDVFLVGWANINGIVGTTQVANYLYNFKFGGTLNASRAAVQVGKTTGRLFGLLDDSGTPTALFHEYFGI